MFRSYGYIDYDPRGPGVKFRPNWMILRCDSFVKDKKLFYKRNSMDAYYRWLIRKNRFTVVSSDLWLSWRGLSSDRSPWKVKVKNRALTKSVWGPHISVIRGERIKNKKLWDAYQKEKVWFEYDPRYINTNGKHWWFRIISPRLKEIRIELGLTPQPMFYSHKEKKKKVNPFHYTIGVNADGVI